MRYIRLNKIFFVANCNSKIYTLQRNIFKKIDKGIKKCVQPCSLFVQTRVSQSGAQQANICSIRNPESEKHDNK